MSNLSNRELVSPAWLAQSPATVAKAVRERGYMVLDGALTADCVSRINAETGDLRAGLNTNWPGPVHFKNQRYLTHCLANSETVFDLMTRSWCFDLLKAYFGSGFRLTDQRLSLIHI